jgi:DNA mismatch endonuclease, patch repair protein
MTGSPPARDVSTRRRMQAVKRRDTKPELLLRSGLHRRGLRFFVDRAPLPGMRRRADLVFPRKRVAVYVDGCFWHGCPIHGTWPKNNADWWREKIETNQARDRDTDRRLQQDGWQVIRVWEHDAATAADSVIEAVLDLA